MRKLHIYESESEDEDDEQQTEAERNSDLATAVAETAAAVAELERQSSLEPEEQAAIQLGMPQESLGSHMMGLLFRGVEDVRAVLGITNGVLPESPTIDAAGKAIVAAETAVLAPAVPAQMAQTSSGSSMSELTAAGPERPKGFLTRRQLAAAKA